MVIFSNGGSSVSDSESEFSSAVIAINSSNSVKISSLRRVPSMEWGFYYLRLEEHQNVEDTGLIYEFGYGLGNEFPWLVMTMAVSEHFFHTKPSIDQRFIFMLRESSDFYEESVEKSWGIESANESDSKSIPYSKEFMNVFMRIGFGSTIKLRSFDKSQVVTFNTKFIRGFWNSDCRIGSRSDNMVDNPHEFFIHWIIISKNIKKVTEVIDVKNWRVDNSWVLWWIISLIVWNSSVFARRSLRFRVRSSSGKGSTSSELEARVCIQERNC
ncbi:hypothetical protein Tco_0461134 [Tanacetum coccineum]